MLTVHVVFDPREGNGAFFAALAEPEQEGPGALVAQKGLFALLTDEAQDEPATYSIESGQVHLIDCGYVWAR